MLRRKHLAQAEWRKKVRLKMRRGRPQPFLITISLKENIRLALHRSSTRLLNISRKRRITVGEAHQHFGFE